MHDLDLALDAAAAEFRTCPAAGDLLVSKVLDIIKPGEQAEALRFLLADHLGGYVAGLSLLDECDNDSYAVVDGLAATLAGAIVGQDRTASALREVVRERIEHRAESLAILGDGLDWPSTFAANLTELGVPLPTPDKLAEVQAILGRHGITRDAIDAHAAAEQAGIAGGTIVPLKNP